MVKRSIVGTAFVLLVQQSAGLIVGVRPAYVCASRAGTPSAITLPAKVLAAGSALAFWRQRSTVAEEKRERFAGMEWARGGPRVRSAFPLPHTRHLFP